MLTVFIISAGISLFSTLKLRIYLKPRRKLFVWFEFVLLCLILLIPSLMDPENIRYAVTLLFPPVICICTVFSFSEPAACKLYNAISQSLLTLAVLYLAESLFRPLSWAWVILIVSAHAVWCAIMYLMRLNYFTYLPLTESSYIKGIVCCILCYLLLLFCYTRDQKTIAEWFARHFSIIIPLLAIGMIVILIDGFIYTSAATIAKQKLEIMERQDRIMKQYIDSLELYRKRIGIIEHDNRHLMTCLSELIQKGNTDRALQLLHAEAGKESQVNQYCNNSLLNALLEDFFQRSQAIGVPFSCTVRLPEEIEIDDNDLTSLFMNIANNAIEHCSTLEKNPSSFIRILIYTHGGFLVIRSENTEESALQMRNGRIHTSKQDDGRPHGLGLESIRMTAEKYGGRVTISEENKIFHISVILENRRLPVSNK